MSSTRTIEGIDNDLKPIQNVDNDIHVKRNTLKLMHLLSNLKTQKRTGWIRNGISQPESISDHMWRMSILSLLIQIEDIDKTKACQLALVHDIAECIVGDIAPSDNIDKKTKNDLEYQAMETIVDKYLVGNSNGLGLWELWIEYEKQESNEAKYVKDLDRLEMCLQAYEYERSNSNVILKSFYDSLRSIRHPSIKEYAMLLIEERNQMDLS